MSAHEVAGSRRPHRQLRRQTLALVGAVTLAITVLAPTSAGAARPATTTTSTAVAVAVAKSATAKSATAQSATASSPTASSPTCGGSRIAKPGGGTWTCTFDEEFNEPSLDTRYWTAVNTSAAGYHSGPECFSDSTSNVKVSDGRLNLTVRRLPKPFTCVDPYGNYTSQYTAGQVVTHGKFSQLYGRYSIRALFPATFTPGLQSSLWLWPENSTRYGAKWPASGEIDVAEEYSQYADRVIPFVHYLYDKTTTDPTNHVNVVTNNFCMVTNVHAYHTYTLVWSPTQLVVSFDDHVCMTDQWHSSLSGTAPFNAPFGIQLTQTLGINTNAFLAGTTPLPATTKVDWVRVWK